MFDPQTMEKFHSILDLHTELYGKEGIGYISASDRGVHLTLDVFLEQFSDYEVKSYGPKHPGYREARTFVDGILFFAVANADEVKAYGLAETERMAV